MSAQPVYPESGPVSAEVALPAVSAWSLMPWTSAAQSVLRERAELLARREDEEQVEAREQYVRFRLGPTELYGIAYAYVEEITQVMEITGVPCTPPAIVGVANYRGELLTILDLMQFFRTEQGTRGEESKLIVVKAGGGRVGLIVDGIEGNDEYAPSGLAPALASTGVSNLEYVQGIDQGRVTIVNIGVLLADPALRVDEAV